MEETNPNTFEGKNMSEENNPLNELIGREISSIEFVRDYIQIRFDGPCLTAVTQPTVIDGKAEYERGDLKYYDVLINCINQVIKSAIVLKDKAIMLTTSSDKVISISLEPHDYTVPEAATFKTSKGQLWVW